MLVEIVSRPVESVTSASSGHAGSTAVPAADVIFEALPSLGMDRMTAGGVEFVICASALTAQV